LELMLEQEKRGKGMQQFEGMFWVVVGTDGAYGRN